MAERSKVCADCKESKPWSEYGARTRWEDGSVRNVQACCRVCNAERCRQWRQRGGEDPVKRRARQLRWLHSLPPEQVAIRRDQQREWWRRKLGVTPDQYRPRRRKRVDAARVFVDAAPFAVWLRTVGDYPEQVALRAHMNPRRARALWHGEQATVEVDTVDRALLAVGDGTSLDDLYPNVSLDNALEAA
jgi:hypothetical protein